MKILVNHIGYELNGSKIALAECREGESLPEKAIFSVLREGDGAEIYSGELGPKTAVSGWKGRFYREIDFSAVEQAGGYSIRVGSGGFRLESSLFQIGEGLLAESCLSDILFYFKSQRSSWRWDEADSKAPFFGERKDRVDVHGGWYDASGDYSKYLSHLSYANYLNPQQIPLVVWALFSLKDSAAGNGRYAGTLLEDRFVEEALWGADFLMRMQDPEGYFYITLFDRWSKDTEKRMISAFRGKEGIRMDNYQAGFRQGGGVSIAALARASRCGSRGKYTPREYLQAAERGWDHLERHNLEYLDNGRENLIDHYCALLAAGELFRATGSNAYLKAARVRAGKLRSLYNSDKGYWNVEEGSERPFYHASDAGLPLVALMEYEGMEPLEERKAETAAFIRRVAADLLSVSEEVDNPFSLMRQWIQPVGGGIRSSFFIPHENESGYWWQGENARLGSLSCALRRAKLYFKETDPEMIPRLDLYADSQLHWILGRNPYDMCMLQGHGRSNPRYEEHYPNAPGGICNGITAGFEDEEDIDFLPPCVEGRGDHRWRWSEQWIPHAAWFLLALGAHSEGWRQ